MSDLGIGADGLPRVDVDRLSAAGVDAHEAGRETVEVTVPELFALCAAVARFRFVDREEFFMARAREAADWFGFAANQSDRPA